jgi:hypothetical protein
MPTRRVWKGLLPSFFVGLAVGVLFIIPDLAPIGASWVLPPVWMLLYGCGLHAAGFFMQRSIKLFGWIFIFLGVATLFGLFLTIKLQTTEVAHNLMGICFGLIHLAFGIYLFFTEPRKNET